MHETVVINKATGIFPTASLDFWSREGKYCLALAVSGSVWLKSER